MSNSPEILCIGSVLWDVIGRSTRHMLHGADVPGRISRLPGGVAMNIAMTLRRFGLNPALLTSIGKDQEGRELLKACKAMGMDCDYVYISEDLPTDRYMAVEGANGLIAAIADAHSLEAAGDKILRPLKNGRLGSAQAPYNGVIALDGNLTLTLLEQIAVSPLFIAADLRVAPASPGKAERLAPLLAHPKATIYVNLEEAGLLCQTTFASSEQAANALLKRGAQGVLVTDGGKSASVGRVGRVITQTPPEVLVTRVTGAGDTFMAAHIAAEIRGEKADQAGIQVFATGGIGGVHRGAETTFDISADLYELAQTPVTVVAAGPKAILDVPKTLEVLETLGVPVISFGQNNIPAFWSRDSGLPSPLRMDSAAQIAKAQILRRELGLPGGQLVANPIPAKDEIPNEVLAPIIEQALAEAKGVLAKSVTPFLLQRIFELTGGASLEANIALVLNNARLAAEISCAFNELE